MRRIGSLDEWLRFLAAHDGDEAGSQLSGYSRQLDVLYDDLSRLVVALYDSPSGEVADALLIARTALAEGAGMLDSVKARFDNGEREPA